MSVGRSDQATAQAAIATLAFFDIFNYPLTALEIWRWLYQQPAGFAELLDTLERLRANSRIGSSNGYFFLAGRKAILEQRFARYQLAEHKYRIALRAARVLRFVPFVEGIAVCNTLGYSNAAKESDIDFFIVARHGRIWLVRLLVTALVSGMGIRRHGQKIADRVCLSFYVSDAHLDISDIALDAEDIYLVYWLATLVPIYDRQEHDQQCSVYQRLLKENVKLHERLPNFFSCFPNQRRRTHDSRPGLTWRRSIEYLLGGAVGNGLENLSRTLQLEKMKHTVAAVGHQPNARVLVSDQMLKFHEQDRREEYRMRWRQRVAALDAYQ